MYTSLFLSLTLKFFFQLRNLTGHWVYNFIYHRNHAATNRSKKKAKTVHKTPRQFRFYKWEKSSQAEVYQSWKSKGVTHFMSPVVLFYGLRQSDGHKMFSDKVFLKHNTVFNIRI